MTRSILSNHARLRAMLAAPLLTLAAGHAAMAEKTAFDIETSTASAALVEFGRQSATELLFAYDVVKGHRANAVVGEYEPVDALRLVLKGTGLDVREKAGGMLVVSQETQDRAGAQSRAQPGSGEGFSDISATALSDNPGGTPGNRLLLAQASSPSPSSSASSSQGATAANPESSKLEEIVVTGTAGGAGVSKLDASFAISTVNAEEITRFSPSSTADLLKTIPGVWSESSGGVSGANILLRGLPGTSDAPWVTVQVDGAPIYPPSTLSFLENSTLFRVDETIARLEGLRGGPSPIFSNGQPGLTTNFILKEGGEETKGVIKYSTSDYDLSRVDAVVSGKISDGFYYMMGGYLSSSPGVRDAGFNAEEGNQFTINLTREFDNGKIKVFHRRTDDHGTWYLPQDLLNPALDAGYTQIGPLTRQQVVEFSQPTLAGGSVQRRETFDLGKGRGWDGSVTGASASFDVGDSGITVTDRMSLTQGDANTYGLVPAGNGVRLNTLRNAGGVLLTSGGTGATTGRAIPGTALVQIFGPWIVEKEIDAFTNDLSLAKAWGDTAKVTVGYYSSSFSVDEFWTLGNGKWFEQRQGGEMIAEVGCNGVPQAQTDACPGSFNFDVDAKGKATSDALYVAGEVGLGPVRLDAGVRFGKYAAQYTGDLGALNGSVDVFADTDESKTSYTAAANWSINDTMGVFARINQGYLEPFFDDFRNSNGLLNQNGVDLFQKVRQFELGYKLSTDTLSVYATYFNNKVEGAPSGCVVGSGLPCLLQENKAQGVEIDANLLLAGAFALDLNATWQDTEITNGPNRGHEVGRQPSLQARLSPSYTLEFADGYDATLYATFSWIDDRFGGDDNTVVLPSYNKVDLGVLFNVDHLNFQVAVDNLTDEEALTEGDPRNPTAPAGRFILPRNIKFTVGYRF